jgi:malonyl-CoA O-methyltransferase
MPVDNTASIAARFSASAATYDGSASIQKAVAERVASLVSDLPKPRLVLEVGCGTGLLTERLLEALPKARIHALDISKAMIEQAQTLRGSAARVEWIVADAREFASTQRYDLIVSSSSLHWILPIEEAFRALNTHLNEGGHLAFGMMLSGTLAELHAARQRVVAGKPAATTLPKEPDILSALRLTGLRVARHERSVLRIEYPSAELFLKSVHDQGTTGGAVSRGDRPLNRGELKRLAADYAAHYRSSAGGVTATYDVLYAVAQKQVAT